MVVTTLHYANHSGGASFDLHRLGRLIDAKESIRRTDMLSKLIRGQIYRLVVHEVLRLAIRHQLISGRFSYQADGSDAAVHDDL